MTTLTMARGESRAWNIPIVLSGVPDPLPPEAIVTWTAVRRIGQPPVIEKTSADGILIVDAEEGLAQLQLDPADTLVLDADRDAALTWDVWLDIAGERTSLTSGKGGTLLVRATAQSFA